MPLQARQRLRPQQIRQYGPRESCAGRGDTIAIVSGAFDAYLAPWCRTQELTLFCSSLEQRDGRLTGRSRGAQCVGAEKARRVREHYDLGRFAAIHAYGDTPEDRELLALARHRHYRGEPVA
ncbi:MAG TPA: HAD-IB family phosphatase [Tahibacter sp.]|nr:HAD-IB family phosphatase [Tahibacter sp.]